MNDKLTSKEFKEATNKLMEHCYGLLFGSKEKEYMRNGSRFHNFETAARLDNISPEQALSGMWNKQIVSVKDLINDLARTGEIPSIAYIYEKIGDVINYMLLLNGLIEQRRMNKERKEEEENGISACKL